MGRVSMVSPGSSLADNGRGWPLCGRTREVAAAVAAAMTPGRGVIVAGPDAIGLTSVLGAARARINSTAYVAEVRGAAGTSQTPLAPFAHLIPRLPAEGWTVADQLAALLDALGQRAAGRHLVIVVDDAEWLDPTSATALNQVLENLNGSLLVARHRPTAATSMLDQLWLRGQLDLIELPALSPDQIAEAVCSAYGGELADAAAGHIHQATCGRPGWVRPLVSDAIACEAMRQRDGLWVCERQAFPIPRLTRIVQACLADQPSAISQVLRHAALAEAVPVRVLARLLGQGAIVEAEEAGWITTSEGANPRVRVSVPGVAAAQVQLLSPSAARSMRTEIVREWSAQPSLDPEDELRIVLLARDSDDPPEPAELGRAAAQAARNLQVDLAGELAADALALDPSFDEAVLASIASAVRPARSDAARPADLATIASTDSARVYAVYSEAVNLLWSSGRADAVDALVQAVEGTVTDSLARTDLVGLRAIAAAESWDFCRARELIRQIMTAPHGDIATVLAGEAALGVRGATGQTLSEAPSLDEVEEVLESDPALLSSRADWLARLGIQYTLLGTSDDFDALIERSLPRIAPSQDQGGAAIVASTLGQRELLAGNARTAHQHFIEVARVIDESGPPVWRARNQARLALTAAMMGDPELAEQALERCDRKVADPGHATRILDSMARVWIAAGRGALTKAIDIARECADDARASGAVSHEALLRYQALRFGCLDDVERLQRIAKEHDIPRARLGADHAAALAARDVAELEKVTDAARSLGLTMAALDAQSQAAAIVLERGNNAGFWLALGRASQLRDACEVDSPAWLQVRRPLPLTAREVEVASLVALGLSNADVADRLVISQRTAEGHLQRVFAKLGLHDRGELAAILGALVSDPPRV